MKCLAVYGADVKRFITQERMKELQVLAFSWLVIGEVAVLGWRNESGRDLYLRQVSKGTEGTRHLSETLFDVEVVGY